MTDSDKSFTELKYHIKNIIFFLFLSCVTPFLGIILGIIQYSPSGSADDYYWINPFITIIPIIYFVSAVIFVFKKKILRSVANLIIGIILLNIIFSIYGKNNIKKDYEILFSKIGFIII